MLNIIDLYNQNIENLSIDDALNKTLDILYNNKTAIIISKKPLNTKCA